MTKDYNPNQPRNREGKFGLFGDPGRAGRSAEQQHVLRQLAPEAGALAMLGGGVAEAPFRMAQRAVLGSVQSDLGTRSSIPFLKLRKAMGVRNTSFRPTRASAGNAAFMHGRWGADIRNAATKNIARGVGSVPGRRGVTMGSTPRALSVGHELGHAKFQQGRLGRTVGISGAGMLRSPALVAAGLSSIWADPDSKASKASPWLAGAASVPLLAEEAGASINAMRGLRKAGASPGELRAARRFYGKAFGTYGLAAAAPVVGVLAARAIRKGHKRRMLEQMGAKTDSIGGQVAAAALPAAIGFGGGLLARRFYDLHRRELRPLERAAKRRAKATGERIGQVTRPVVAKGAQRAARVLEGDTHDAPERHVSPVAAALGSTAAGGALGRGVGEFSARASLSRALRRAREQWRPQATYQPGISGPNVRVPPRVIPPDPPLDDVLRAARARHWGPGGLGRVARSRGLVRGMAAGGGVGLLAAGGLLAHRAIRRGQAKNVGTPMKAHVSGRRRVTHDATPPSLPSIVKRNLPEDWQGPDVMRQAQRDLRRRGIAPTPRGPRSPRVRPDMPDVWGPDSPHHPSKYRAAGTPRATPKQLPVHVGPATRLPPWWVRHRGLLRGGAVAGAGTLALGGAYMLGKRARRQDAVTFQGNRMKVKGPYGTAKVGVPPWVGETAARTTTGVALGGAAGAGAGYLHGVWRATKHTAHKPQIRALGNRAALRGGRAGALVGGAFGLGSAVAWALSRRGRPQRTIERRRDPGRTTDYSPNQPRDQAGKFGSGGGSRAVAGAGIGAGIGATYSSRTPDRVVQGYRVPPSAIREGSAGARQVMAGRAPSVARYAMRNPGRFLGGAGRMAAPAAALGLLGAGIGHAARKRQAPSSGDTTDAVTPGRVGAALAAAALVAHALRTLTKKRPSEGESSESPETVAGQQAPAQVTLDPETLVRLRNLHGYTGSKELRAYGQSMGGVF